MKTLLQPPTDAMDPATLAAFHAKEREIFAANPLEQLPIVHDVAGWKTQLAGTAEEVLNQLLEYTDGQLSISRQTIFNAVEKGWEPRCRFLLQMLWGNSPHDGRAPSKVLGYFNNPLIAEEHNYAGITKDLADGKIEEAFNALMKVKGLNTSFLTKVLYFETRTPHNDYALIFDERVAAGVVKLVSPWASSCVESSVPRVYLDPQAGDKANTNRLRKAWIKYWSYVEGCHAIAKALNTQADHVEYFLFQNGQAR